jgi:1,4-alpha-glucan branching enzyme
MAICLHPGTKLLFMDVVGQSAEWNFEGSLDWHLNEYPYHEGVKLITDLNGLYKAARIIKICLVPKFEWIIQTIKMQLYSKGVK